MMSALPIRRWLRTDRSWPVSLRLQLQIGSALLILLLAIAVGTLWSIRSATRIREAAGTALLQTARDMAERLSGEMAARARDVVLLTQIDLFRSAADPTAMRAALERLRDTLPAYAWIGVTDPEGRVIAGTDGVLVGKSIAARPVFAQGRKGLWTGDVHEAVMLAALAPQVDGESVKFVDVAAPIYAADKTFRGVLALHMSWQWAATMREVVLQTRGGAASLRLLVIGAEGQVLLAPRPSAASPVAKNSGDASALPALSPSALQQLDERWGNERWSDGVQSLTAVAESRASGAFQGFGWRVLVRDENAASEAVLAREAHEVWFRSLGAGAAVALLAWGLIGWAMAPMDRLRHALRDNPIGTESIPPDLERKHTARRNDVQQIASQISRLQETLQKQQVAMRDLEHSAHHDELTGLFNRTYLAQLNAKLEEAPSATLELCVLCLDLDHFKPINDTFGHAAGDDVLKQVGARLRQTAREEDFVLRLGGDEFLMLLPCPIGQGAEIARLIATRILSALQPPMTHLTVRNLQIGASIGAAIWQPGHTSLTATIALADQALFAAKRASRGRFRLYSALPVVKSTPAVVLAVESPSS